MSGADQERRGATGLERLARWTFAVTALQIAVGGFTRGSGSGYGCEDRWPLCEDGLLGGLLPRPEFNMVVEWTHRWVASIAVVLVAALTVVAWRRYRSATALRWGSVVALVAILFQAGLGAVVVTSGLDADLVSVHLGVATLLLGVLAYVNVEAAHTGGRRPVVAPRPEPRWRAAVGGGAAAVFAVIVLGSLVHDQFVGPAEFPDGWPLVRGSVAPPSGTVDVLHYAHRGAVALTLLLLVWLALRTARLGRSRLETALVHVSLALFVVNVGLGAAHVFTEVSSSGLVVAHLLVATLAWSGLVAAWSLGRRADAAAATTQAVGDPVVAGRA